jgi:hypothetical protein
MFGGQRARAERNVWSDATEASADALVVFDAVVAPLNAMAPATKFRADAVPTSVTRRVGDVTQAARARKTELGSVRPLGRLTAGDRSLREVAGVSTIEDQERRAPESDRETWPHACHLACWSPILVSSSHYDAAITMNVLPFST